MNKLRKEFQEYVYSCVLSRRPANKTEVIIGRSAAESYLSFVEVDKLFSYNPARWKHIESIFDIDSSKEIMEIFKELMNDETFVRVDGEGASQYFRSNALKQYYCFLRAREIFNQYNKDGANNSCITNCLQQIYYGAPGTGKSHEINRQTENEEVIRTTFHPDSDYSTFVGAYKPTTKEITLRDDRGLPFFEKGEIVTEDRIVYEFVEQAFLQAYINAWKFYAEANENKEVKKQYLVIEEINRGNCAQIFGDLFQLLDRNEWGFSEYPIKADNDMKKHLKKAFDGLSITAAEKINSCFNGKNIVGQVLNGDCLLLPNNLYIWATMNTSDQSLFPIDSAFKRRWDWKYMPIDSSKENWCIRVNNTDYSWTDFLDKVNDVVREKTQSEDKQLGFYFCKAKNSVIDAETFVGKVLFYLWNDVFKDQGFDDEIFEDEKLPDGSFKPLAFRNFYDVKTDKVIETQAEKFLKNLKIGDFKAQDNTIETQNS